MTTRELVQLVAVAALVAGAVMCAPPAPPDHLMVERVPVDPDVVCYRVDQQWAGCVRTYPTLGPLPPPRPGMVQ